ncbi:hypothetical protein TELCIR_24564, partial [Teladorsagia circumcincta]
MTHLPAQPGHKGVTGCLVCKSIKVFPFLIGSTGVQEMDNRPSPRRFSNPSDGMSALTTSFTAAIAANANNARHERYAAHIPVNKGDSGSGRQSTVSQDSQQRLVKIKSFGAAE